MSPTRTPTETSTVTPTEASTDAPAAGPAAAFAAALARLEAVLGAELGAASAPALSAAYYPVSHEAFEAASDQRTLLTEALSALAVETAGGGGAPDMLSVGCGDGVLDAAILAQVSAAGRALAYTGLDVNPESLALFRAKGVSPAPRLLEADFAQWSAPDRFDLVTAVHVIYYAADKRAFLRACAALLRPGGRAVVAVAPFSRMNQLAAVFWRGQTEGDFYADDCAALLQELGIKAHRRRIDARLPLAAYDRDDARIADFTVQTELGGFSGAVREAVGAALSAAAAADGAEAETTGAGEAAAPFLAHPVDLFEFAAPPA